MPRASSSPAAFRRLERRLAQRRLQQLDLKLRVELALLALLIGAFLFWQVRVPLAGVVQRSGPAPAAGWLLVALLVLVAFGALLVARHLAGVLRRGPDGPEWLAFPILPRDLRAHLDREAGRRVHWVSVPGAGVLAAGIGVLPGTWIGLGTAWFLLLLAVAPKIGAAVGRRLATWGIAANPRTDRVTALLARPRTRETGSRRRAANWMRSPGWWALAAKDVRLTFRNSPLSRRAGIAVVLGLLSLAAWRLPWSLPLRHAVGFALLLLSATSIAEWLVALSGRDPFSLLRSLPVAPWTIWVSRMLWAATAAVVFGIGFVFLGPTIAPEAQRLYLAWSSGAIAGIAMLGVHYGLTLFPRADIAQRLLMLSLSLAMASSLILPLSGWIVLASGVIHSARRLKVWHRLEELPC